MCHKCTLTNQLKEHNRVHICEKPYECETCHTRFTLSSSLIKHVIIKKKQNLKTRFLIQTTDAH